MTTKELPQFEQGSVKKAMQGVTSADLWKVPRERLHVSDGFNVRIHDNDYKAHVRAIADSIKANGYMQDKPLAGYVGKDENGEDVVIITDGHTRLAGYDLAVKEGVEPFELPVVTKPRGTSMEDLTIALVTSNSGRQLSPFEVGTVCQRLVSYGMETTVIAKRLGYGKAYIEGLLDLVAAPKAMRDLVTSGKVSATLAVESIKKHGAKEAVKVLTAGAKEAAAAGKDRVTKKAVKKAVEKKAKKGGKQKGEQATLPGIPEAQAAANFDVTLIERASAWFTNHVANTTMSEQKADFAKGVCIDMLCGLTGLTAEDVAPYFEPATVADPADDEL